MPDWIQRTAAGIALVFASPILAVLAGAIRRDSPGPAFFGATRIGRFGAPFTAWKFRTMSWDPAHGGASISRAADPRITHLGRLLRRSRLDELPQLWNVVRGEMRLVGPRPEDPRFVDASNPDVQVVLSLRPGITGLAQLGFADEARVLDDDNPEVAYRLVVLPRKLLVDLAYARHRSGLLDLRILVSTILVVLGRAALTERIDTLVGSRDWRLP